MKQKSFKLDIWNGSGLFILITYLLFLVYPLGSLLKQAVVVSGSLSLENFVTFFSKTYYSETLINSFKVSITATICALIVGILLAYLFAMYEFKGKKVLQILIVIASMSAPFIGAYSWILLLGRNGIITTFLANVFHITMPDIYGFTGITLVFTLQLFPLIFLYVSGAFKSIDNSLLEAAESMGSSGISRFFKVILPLLLPTILAGALLVFMRAFSDFGTPMLIGEGYRTFPVLIYTEFMSEVGGDASFASSLAVIAIIIALTIFLIQKYIANKNTFTMSSLHPISQRSIKGVKKAVVYIVSYGIVFLAILPQLYLIYTSFLNTQGMVFVPGYSLNSYREAFNRMGSAIFNTIRIPLMALVIVVIFSIFISYLTVKKKNTLTATIDILSMIPYIVPGTVLGISYLAAFNTGIANSGILAITGTALIIVISLTVRRLPYTIRSSVATLGQIPDSIEEAASSLGSSKLNTFARITVPMMVSGIVSGAILSWITMISELSTSILLYNVNTKTMPVAIYTEVIRGNYGIAAALSTILTAITVASLLLFMKVTKSDSITM
ncbi:iron ABC transporter permease [Vagococcus lutrae]|uniref:ABC transporter permease n=1 Tax=Vagococcus lutrae TaxID=81947 RepID=UPI001926EE1C|nr:iron ABC transporter permease [Vagococcus lutrae]MCO7150815.1 iron ABC transporter permease [Vagococcus lutrae]MDT2802170.1 iron ABC transporter permease [Vagococcus lutrae]MDT2806729.1 iron ABC transporter permease [Vagococcus lutrae]MDT2811610.1 iron ABC transporter permease [Vagococcus lutrae]MDT2817740.1 iron ABC transporter permease [Vagococcus lutrae]